MLRQDATCRPAPCPQPRLTHAARLDGEPAAHAESLQRASSQGGIVCVSSPCCQIPSSADFGAPECGAASALLSNPGLGPCCMLSRPRAIRMTCALARAAVEQKCRGGAGGGGRGHSEGGSQAHAPASGRRRPRAAPTAPGVRRRAPLGAQPAGTRRRRRAPPGGCPTAPPRPPPAAPTGNMPNSEETRPGCWAVQQKAPERLIKRTGFASSVGRRRAAPSRPWKCLAYRAGRARGGRTAPGAMSSASSWRSSPRGTASSPWHRPQCSRLRSTSA